MLKIFFATLILLLGGCGIIYKVFAFRKDPSKGFKAELVDVVFFFPFTGFLLSLVLFIIGAGWLYHLLAG
jgi:hypothetical protein